MPDVPMPEEMIAWMRQSDWSAHHQQRHFERRWDFWHAMAQRTDLPDEARQEIQEMVAEAVANGWTRAAVPEGTAGGGEEFLSCTVPCSTCSRRPFRSTFTRCEAGTIWPSRMAGIAAGSRLSLSRVGEFTPER